MSLWGSFQRWLYVGHNWEGPARMWTGPFSRLRTQWNKEGRRRMPSSARRFSSFWAGVTVAVTIDNERQTASYRLSPWALVQSYLSPGTTQLLFHSHSGMLIDPVWLSSLQSCKLISESPFIMIYMYGISYALYNIQYNAMCNIWYISYDTYIICSIYIHMW